MTTLEIILGMVAMMVLTVLLVMLVLKASGCDDDDE